MKPPVKVVAAAGTAAGTAAGSADGTAAGEIAETAEVSETSCLFEAGISMCSAGEGEGGDGGEGGTAVASTGDPKNLACPQGENTGGATAPSQFCLVPCWLDRRQKQRAAAMQPQQMRMGTTMAAIRPAVLAAVPSHTVRCRVDAELAFELSCNVTADVATMIE